MPDHPLKTDVHLAQAMARYIAGTSMLEVQLSGVFTALIGDWQMTEVILHREQGVQRRADLVLEMATLLPDDDPRKAELASMRTEIADRLRYRNKLAHGIFTLPWEGEPVELLTSVVGRKSKMASEPVSAEIIYGELTKLREIINRLEVLGFRSLPPKEPTV